MIKVGISGGAGYVAGELVRILVNHPGVELTFVHSESSAGLMLCQVHEGLIGETSLRFTDKMDLNAIDVLFLCGAHGHSAEFWKDKACPENLRIIDMAQDFRDESEGYVYGLPELQRGKIVSGRKIANPGCFATAIQLALLPLASASLLKDEVSVTAITGSTGAGVKPSATSHFSWRNGNISSYKVFEHQHLKEIRRNLSLLGAGACPEIDFVPVRGDFTRGIFVTLHTSCPLEEAAAVQMYRNYYEEAAFTHVWDGSLDLKQVVNTNKCLLHVEKHYGKLVVTSVIDNLLKGAAGQAVQNMNLMFGLDEREGLKLKASAF